MTLVLAAGALAAPAPARSQELDLSQPITYFVAEGSARSGFRQGDRALAEWAVQAWAGQAGPAVVVKSAPEGSASIRIYWVSADEGLFGTIEVEGEEAAAWHQHAMDLGDRLRQIGHVPQPIAGRDDGEVPVFERECLHVAL